ncbi:MAG: hypothetical protein ACOX5J_15255 [Candidatus Hydrogenedentales bacterium]
MLETLLEKKARWLSGEGPEADLVIESGGTLVRNLADLPFPGLASDDELHNVLDRVLGAMEGHGMFRSGQFFMIEHLEPRVLRFLLERRLITPDMEHTHGPCGVWLSDDQAFSVMINGRDHVRLQARSAGFNFDEVWTQLSRADDILGGKLDFAFHDKFGYLSASVAEVGTGFGLFAIAHLAGLAMNNRMLSRKRKGARKRAPHRGTVQLGQRRPGRNVHRGQHRHAGALRRGDSV